MNIKNLLICLAALSAFSMTAHGQVSIVEATAATVNAVESTSNAMDELDPFDPNVMQTLQDYDQKYQDETGQSAHIGNKIESLLQFSISGCYRQSCEIYALVMRSRQMLYLYENGSLIGSWKTSTGVEGRETPDFDTHPDGRIYDSYTSTKFPGGDYNGLGNMPYAVFISGGFAIHGTGVSNWPRLGHPASHGCIRIHPDNAFIFNRKVRQAGTNNTWITVQD